MPGPRCLLSYFSSEAVVYTDEPLRCFGKTGSHISGDCHAPSVTPKWVASLRTSETGTGAPISERGQARDGTCVPPALGAAVGLATRTRSSDAPLRELPGTSSCIPTALQRADPLTSFTQLVPIQPL